MKFQNIEIQPLHMLYYTQEATDWNEALPLGNGRIGAMVFGGTKEERIALNEDTLWSGEPVFHERPNAASAFQKAQELTKAGQYQEAEHLLENEFTSQVTEMYLPLGDMLLSFPEAKEISEYRRVLDLQSGVHTVTYIADGVSHMRETFVSEPAQVMVMCLRASLPGALSFRMNLCSQLEVSTCVEGNQVIMTGMCPSSETQFGALRTKLVYTSEKKGMRFAAVAQVLTDGKVERTIGEVEEGRIGGGNLLSVEGASYAEIYFATRTSFEGWNVIPTATVQNCYERCMQDLEQATKQGYAAVLEKHLQDYRALYERTELWLETTEESFLPTDERLMAHNEGKKDSALYALLFHYGRYLTIAGSRKGTQALNLQGIWNHRLKAPWKSNYTLNINTEMNYWPTLAVNLAECCEPLIQMIGELRESGKRTAKAYYDAPGFCVHHNSDIWRHTTPVGNGERGALVWSYWPMAGGWMMRHLYEYWEYTQDETFLRETAFPIFLDCAKFYLALLQEEEDGSLVFRPSTSPENSFLLPNGEPCSLGDWATMSHAIIRDVFSMTLHSAKLLGIQGEMTKQLQEALPRVKGYEISSTGSVLEFNEEFVQRDPHHRHLSHLYGLYPGCEMVEDASLLAAAKQTLLERGDEGTGWSLSWKVNFWARLRDGEKARALIDMHLRICREYGVSFVNGGTYPNLFCAHPPFQIDGNFGICAGIVEMLLQGDAANPILLPALPKDWKNGRVRGLCLPGGRKIDFEWKDGKVITAKWIWLNPSEYPKVQESPAAISLGYDTADYQYCVAEFEKNLEFPKEIRAVKLRVSGDAQFRLWVNGELVGIGPASSGGDFLTEEALPWHYANYYELEETGTMLRFFAQVQLLPQVLTEFSQGHGGFYLEGEVIFTDGTSHCFGTDENWKVRKNNRFAAPKVYDECIAPDEWHRAEIVENRWNLIDAPIPMLTLESISPQSCKKREEADAKIVEESRVKVCAGDKVTVLFDKIYSAYLGIRADGPCSLTLYYFELEGDKESQEKIALTKAGEFFTFRLHSVGGMRIQVQKAGQGDGDCVEIEPFLLFSHYPVEREGTLKTSDALLNKVYDVSKWALKICRQTIHLDSPKHQELLACTGDYFIETKMTAFTFGDMRLAQEDIRRTARWLEINDGRMFHTNYSLIWVQWIWFTYLFTGDVSLLNDCKEALKILLERFHSYLGDNGVLEHAPDYMFVDWVVRDGYSIHHPPKALGQTVLNAFYYKALTEAVKIAEEAQKVQADNWVQLKNVWEQRKAELKIHFNENFYDEASRLYIDGLMTPTENNRWLPENPKKQYISRYSNTLAVLYGLCKPEDAKRLVRFVADRSTNLPQVQPYFMHFVLEAVYQEGLFEEYGMKMLDLWKEMVDTCDKGLQEGWIAPEPNYKFDHSHAWGGTPAYHLPLALTGFEMLEPGFRKVAFKPNLWGLEFAEIHFPTPYGEICCVMKEGAEPEITVPEEIEALML